MMKGVTMKLRPAGSRTYYIEHSTNIGVYMISDRKVCLIDTGRNGDGEKIDELISSEGWEIEYIINTHTHIDHLGGNRYLMGKYHVPAYCADIEIPFAHCSELEAAYMNGGKPCRKLREVFTHTGRMGFRSVETSYEGDLQWIYLPGHSFGMIGVKTPDDVWFTADAYMGRDGLKRHSFAYMCDVEAYMNTLEKIKTLEGRLFIPSHGDAEESAMETAELNLEKTRDTIDLIRDICSEEISLDDILKQLYMRLEMRTNIVNHALISSTAKCYLTYLQDRGELECSFSDCILHWKRV